MGKAKVRHNRTSTKGKTFPAGKGGTKTKTTFERKPWKCPRCGKMTTDYPALSRRDNKTEICSQCGTEEALYDYFSSKKGVKEGLEQIESRTKKITEKEAYPTLTKKDYYNIATRTGLGYGDRSAYVEFMTRRFPNESDTGYATEWAERFKLGTHWGHCDTESEGYLLKAYNIKSAKKKWK